MAENRPPDADREAVLIDAARREAAALEAAARVPAPPANAVPGYELREEIGRGGMGVVYKALQVSTRRLVAVKVMLGGGFASTAARERFRREIELAAGCQHPSIARILVNGRSSAGIDGNTAIGPSPTACDLVHEGPSARQNPPGRSDAPRPRGRRGCRRPGRSRPAVTCPHVLLSHVHASAGGLLRTFFSFFPGGDHRPIAVDRARRCGPARFRVSLGWHGEPQSAPTTVGRESRSVATEMQR